MLNEQTRKQNKTLECRSEVHAPFVGFDAK